MNCTQGGTGFGTSHILIKGTAKMVKTKILGHSPYYKILTSLAMKFMLQMAKDSALKANI